MKLRQKTTFLPQNSDSDIRSRELASKYGGLAYFFKFEDQEEAILVISLRFKLLQRTRPHRLRTIEGLFSMVIPSNIIAVHTKHLAGEEHETIWSTVSCIRKQHGSRETRDQTRTTDHLIESLSR